MEVKSLLFVFFIILSIPIAFSVSDPLLRHMICSNQSSCQNVFIRLTYGKRIDFWRKSQGICRPCV